MSDYLFEGLCPEKIPYGLTPQCHKCGKFCVPEKIVIDGPWEEPGYDEEFYFCKKCCKKEDLR